MTTWTFEKDKKGLLLSKQVGEKKPLKIGYTKSPEIGEALFEASGQFQPGDLVITPESINLVYPRQGWLNN
jgi:hypothetical protein